MKTDAIYSRYSSHAQDDGTSNEVQIEQCERSAGGKCNHYIDRAKTGRSMSGRTELLRLLADAEAGETGRLLTGAVRFNLRKMQLNRTTGRRVAKQKAVAEHLERLDDALRILDDETFAKIQARIGRQATGEATNAPRGTSLFIGLVFCECGAKCYKVTSENKKGSYNYYVCRRHLDMTTVLTSPEFARML